MGVEEQGALSVRVILPHRAMPAKPGCMELVVPLTVVVWAVAALVTLVVDHNHHW
jgi:hypothetical protein